MPVSELSSKSHVVLTCLKAFLFAVKYLAFETVLKVFTDGGFGYQQLFLINDQNLSTVKRLTS